jgi:fluoroacetyl-CoA thioesterase
MSHEPQPDTLATATLIVGQQDLASSIASETGDSFPPVFATARMVALMEIAASRVLVPLCGPGELSVGVTVDINHTAPTPLGAEVTATARYAGREGKLFLFEVSCADKGGEVGRGWHKRAIVSSERLQSGAAKRAG